ncbi:MAG: DNA alkylation repair protein [Bryobacteraceae bacterium]
MTVPELLQFINREFEAGAEPQFAKNLRWFFKETVDPYGVRGAQIRQLAAAVYREIKHWPAKQRDQVCEALWKTGKLEGGILVSHLYRRFYKQCGAREFAVFERWIDRYVRNWAHTDGVASWLLAACIRNDPALIERLYLWTRARNRWKRRASAVALLQEAKQGRNTESIFRVADLLFGDADEIVQKGVGWLLKEAYPRKPAATVDFLSERKAKASRLTLRYAAEKMTSDDKKTVLQRVVTP